MTVHRLLTPEDVARVLSVSTRTLADWRVDKKGPKHINMNGKAGAVRYPEDKLILWQQEEFERSWG